MENGKIVIYRTADGETSIDVKLEMIQYGLRKRRWRSFFKRINR